MLEWYAWLSQLNAALSEPLTTWSERLNIPVITALLLGLLGSTAPSPTMTCRGGRVLETDICHGIQGGTERCDGE